MGLKYDSKIRQTLKLIHEDMEMTKIWMIINRDRDRDRQRYGYRSLQPQNGEDFLKTAQILGVMKADTTN